jgi:hypothetical protein
MNINEAIKIAVQESGRPLEDVVGAVYMSKKDIEEAIALFAKDQPYPHPFTLLPRIDSHWDIAFKDKAWSEDFDVQNSYIVYFNGDCHEFKMSDVRALFGIKNAWTLFLDKMKKKFSIIIFIVLSVIFIIAGILGWMKWEMYNPPKSGHTRHWKFLHKTDYRKLRKACIKVIKNRHSYNSNPRIANPNVNPNGPIFIAPEDKALPDALKKINPSIIVVSKSRLIAHFHHGTPTCSHHGIVVFLDENDITDKNCTDQETTALYGPLFEDQENLLIPNAKLVPWIKVIPNLWYFDVWFSRTGHCQQSKKEVETILKEQVRKQN